jgi:hypothetical protein
VHLARDESRDVRQPYSVAAGAVMMNTNSPDRDQLNVKSASQYLTLSRFISAGMEPAGGFEHSISRTQFGYNPAAEAVYTRTQPALTA